jgi:hypothetical protein
VRKTFRITGTALLVVIVSLFVYMLSPTAATPTLASRPEGARQTSRGSNSSAINLITVLNPEIPNKVTERAPLIPRLDTVDGKTIWFVSMNWGDVKSTAIFFEELQKWFAKNHPTTKLVYKVKKGSFGGDDAALMKELVANADAAILGLAG